MSFLAPLLPAAGMAIGGILGGATSSAPQVNYQPPGFNAGGLTATFGGNGYNISPSADRTAAVGGVANTFAQQAGALGALGAQYTPGFSALRAAQLGALSSSRTATMGNLSAQLGQRRILGSSFAQNQLTNAQSQFDQDQSQIIASTYLQELQASQQIIQQQYTAARGQFQTGLDEMNLEAGIAASLTGKASSTLEQAASIQAQLDAKAAAGTGSFFGSLGSMAGTAFGKMFGGTGAAAGISPAIDASAGASAGTDVSAALALL